MKYTVQQRDNYYDSWMQKEFESLNEAIDYVMNDAEYFHYMREQRILDGGRNVIATREKGPDSDINWRPLRSPFVGVQKAAFRERHIEKITILEEQRLPVFLIRAEIDGVDQFGWWHDQMGIDDIQWNTQRWDLD
jgi:hypothetical protein